MDKTYRFIEHYLIVVKNALHAYFTQEVVFPPKTPDEPLKVVKTEEELTEFNAYCNEDDRKRAMWQRDFEWYNDNIKLVLFLIFCYYIGRHIY